MSLNGNCNVSSVSQIHNLSQTQLGYKTRKLPRIPRALVCFHVLLIPTCPCSPWHHTNCSALAKYTKVILSITCNVKISSDIQWEWEVKVRLLVRCNCGPQVSPLCEKGMIASIPVTWFYWEERSMIIISSSRRSRSRISGTENMTLPSRIIFWGWLAGSGFLMGWSWLPMCECD